MDTPPPEVTHRPALPGEVPRGAAHIITLATTRGFVVRTSYARGPSGKLHAMTDSILVRANHPDGRRAVASWLAAPPASGGAPPAFKFEFAYVTRPYVEHVNSAHLRAYLEGTP